MQATRKGLFYGYYLVAVSFVLTFVSGVVYLHSRGVLARDQLLDFDISRTELSTAFSAVHISGALFAPLLGDLLDRFGARRIMIFGAVWLTAGFAVLTRVEDIVTFALSASVFIAVGQSSIGHRAASRLLVNWFDRRRGIALATMIMGASVAGVATPPLTVYLLDSIGWRATYGVFAALCLLLVLPLVVAFVRDHPADCGTTADGVAPSVASGADAAAARTDGSWRAFVGFARAPAFWGVVLLFGVMDGVFGGLSLHLFLHYTSIGLDDYGAARLLSVGSAMSLVSKPTFGWLVDRLGARNASAIAVLACGLSMAALTVATAPFALLAAAALIGLGFGGTVPLQAALVSRVFAAAEFGRAFGALRLCTLPLNAACMVLIGYVYDASGGYRMAFGIYAAAFAAVALFAFRAIPAAAAGRAVRP